MSDYIPEEGIILQILHKLPTKSLVRFTCVSKSWLSLIKNPSFISNHLKHSNKNTLLLLLFYCPGQNNRNHAADQYSLYCDYNNQGFKYNPYRYFHVPFDTHWSNPFFRIVCTVNGLICLVDDFYFENIIIWNPFIKKSVTLPRPTTISNPASYELNPVSFGFGFDSKANDYKVLRLGKCEEEEVPQVYSLNKNSWKRVCPPTYRITDIKEYRFMQVFVNGVIHVLAYRIVRNNDNQSVKYYNFILGFDVGDEVFKEIKLPQSLELDADWYSNCLRLLVYKESIAVIDHDWFRSSGIHVWVMEEYGVVESWKKVLSFNGEGGNWPNVFGFRKNGELFLEFPNGKIVLYDHESTKCTSIEVSGSSGSHTVVDYFVESMELLDNANAQSDPPDENDAIRDPADDPTVAAGYQRDIKGIAWSYLTILLFFAIYMCLFCVMLLSFVYFWKSRTSKELPVK